MQRKYNAGGFVICLKHLKSQAMLIISAKYLTKMRV